MAEKVYGARENSYGVVERQDGWIELRVYHRNTKMREYLKRHIGDSRYFLERREAYARNNLAAKRWLARMIKDYRPYFEQGRVEITFR